MNLYNQESFVLARYHALPPTAKIVMAVKALIGLVVTNKTLVFNALNAVGGRETPVRRWTVPVLNGILEDLQQQHLLDEKLVCAESLLHVVTAEAVEGLQGGVLLEAVQQLFPFEIPRNLNGVNIRTNENALRRLRLAIYTNDETTYARLREIYEANYAPALGENFLVRLFLHAPVDVAWLSQRTPHIQNEILAIKFSPLLREGVAPPTLLPLLGFLRARPVDPARTSHAPWLVGYHLRAGHVDILRHFVDTLEDDDGVATLAYRGSIDFISGHNDEAIAHFRESLKRMRQITRKRKIFFEGIFALYFLLAMLRAKEVALVGEIQASLDMVAWDSDFFRGGFAAVQAMVWLVQGMNVKARSLLKANRLAKLEEPLSVACLTLAEFFLDGDLAREHFEESKDRWHHLREPLPLVAHIHAGVLARLGKSVGGTDQFFDFTDIVQIRQPWERALDSVGAFLRSGKPAMPARSGSTPTKRLAWFLNPVTLTVEVMEQTLRVRNGWSEGRIIAMKRLYEQDPRLNYLSDHDRRVLRTLRKEDGGWYQSDEYHFETEKTLPALIGHVALFDARQREQAIELVAYPVELVVTDTRQGYRLALSRNSTRPAIFLEEETPTRFRLIEFGERLLALQEIIGKKGLAVPRQGREPILSLLQEQGLSLPVRAEITDLELPGEEGVTTPVLQLRPLEQGLKVSLSVRPFGNRGPYYMVGQGNASVLAPFEGQHRRVNRNLPGELLALAGVYEACPLLQQLLAGGHQGVVEGMEYCLELLLELGECSHPVTVEWPEGKPLRVYPPASATELILSLKQTRDWFRVEGEIRVDPQHMVTMGEILGRLDQAHGRFVPLDDGRFVTLTNHFRQQLERLRGVTEEGREGRRLSALGAVAVQDLVDEAGEVKADKPWQELSARIRSMAEYQPVVPSTLQAELRDYQVEGFVWLSRLAHWGVGACLADDMGLGKTVQTIALLLEQAPAGPCLVVAPTSVCHNWQRELAKFAPTLAVDALANSGDRATLVGEMGPMRVLVVSYGMLHTELERLAEIPWQVLVLDEAQAIKNAGTRRAQASRKLNAAFRVALTGTPIENYLDELWSLFNVINPGLLGSRESFQKRFAAPIERRRDGPALQALRALVRPFILRRTKSTVLAELPPRTEVTLEVNLPDDERAFHETLRLRALASLEGLAGDEDTQRRFRILAEITRLRRACCHPALVDPESTLPGAKLTLFLELAEELIRNRHKALVFSQFVGHLARVKAALDERGVRYQYLDGSTPVKEREKRVMAFQSGDGDLFLISLKAGGVGLNLTAADYVIHLDPWWNPAVEDQASDRAHRIGQNRPVTIYRMIVQGSIEEKIVQLHRDKRDLADALLEGADASVRLTEEDLLAMIRE